MKAKITEKWLVKKGACEAGVEAFKNQKEADSLKILKNLIRVKKLGWANWLIVRVMTHSQYVSYAVFAAEQVIGIFEKKYPNDNRPRAAINAAQKCIKNPTKKNKAAADAAATDAANAAADAATAKTKLKILKYGISLLKEGKK